MRIRILIVDDDPQVRAVLTLSLQQSGYAVLTADNGREARAMLSANPVDLLITDLFMPEQDGIETILHIRKQHPKLPILAISGGGRRIEGGDCLHIAHVIGANRVLPKPFTMETLLREIAVLVGAGRSG